MKKKVKIQQQYTLLLEISIEQNVSLFNCNDDNLLRQEYSGIKNVNSTVSLF